MFFLKIAVQLKAEEKFYQFLIFFGFHWGGVSCLFTLKGSKVPRLLSNYQKSKERERKSQIVVLLRDKDGSFCVFVSQPKLIASSLPSSIAAVKSTMKQEKNN